MGGWACGEWRDGKVCLCRVEGWDGGLVGRRDERMCLWMRVEGDSEGVWGSHTKEQCNEQVRDKPMKVLHMQVRNAVAAQLVNCFPE